MGEGMERLTGRHPGETCYIVGKGPSLAHVSPGEFASGPIICLNESILHVQELGLTNPIYSMQKDGCEAYRQRDAGCEGCRGDKPPMHYPRKGVTVLLHEHESRNCLPDCDRIVFDAHALGFDWWSTSSPCAIRIARLMGCAEVVLIAHDSLWGDYRTIHTIGDTSVEQSGQDDYEPITRLVRDELRHIPHEVRDDMTVSRHALAWLTDRMRTCARASSQTAQHW